MSKTLKYPQTMENVNILECFDSHENLPVSMEYPHTSGSVTVGESLPSTSLDYEESPLKGTLACSEISPDRGQASSFTVGAGSFNTIRLSVSDTGQR